LFGWLACILLCCIFAVSADRLVLWLEPNFSCEGYSASVFAGACIAWLTLLIGMGVMALLGSLLVPFMKDFAWLWHYWRFGPFLNPVGAFMGAAFLTLPSLLLGVALGLLTSMKGKGS